MNKTNPCCVVVARGEADAGSAGCCVPFERRFVSAKEERERLEKYRDELKKELAGVDQRMKELEGK